MEIISDILLEPEFNNQAKFKQMILETKAGMEVWLQGDRGHRTRDWSRAVHPACAREHCAAQARGCTTALAGSQWRASQNKHAAAIQQEHWIALGIRVHCVPLGTTSPFRTPKPRPAHRGHYFTLPDHI